MFTLKFKMAAVFVKLYMSLPIHRCIYLSNPLRIYRDSIFLKIFVIPGGMRPPKNPTGGLFCHPPKSKWEVPGNNPTTWLNFYTLCKSQLQNAWPVSPTILHFLVLTTLSHVVLVPARKGVTHKKNNTMSYYDN